MLRLEVDQNLIRIIYLKIIKSHTAAEESLILPIVLGWRRLLGRGRRGGLGFVLIPSADPQLSARLALQCERGRRRDNRGARTAAWPVRVVRVCSQKRTRGRGRGIWMTECPTRLRAREAARLGRGGPRGRRSSAAAKVSQRCTATVHYNTATWPGRTTSRPPTPTTFQAQRRLRTARPPSTARPSQCPPPPDRTLRPA